MYIGIKVSNIYTHTQQKWCRSGLFFFPSTFTSLWKHKNNVLYSNNNNNQKASTKHTNREMNINEEGESKQASNKKTSTWFGSNNKAWDDGVLREILCTQCKAHLKLTLAVICR